MCWCTRAVMDFITSVVRLDPSEKRRLSGTLNVLLKSVHTLRACTIPTNTGKRFTARNGSFFFLLFFFFLSRSRPRRTVHTPLSHRTRLTCTSPGGYPFSAERFRDPAAQVFVAAPRSKRVRRAGADHA
jgi:hypothetical protein